MPILKFFILLGLLASFVSCEKDDPTTSSLELQKMFIGPAEVNFDGTSIDIPVDRSITLIFSLPVNESLANASIMLRTEAGIAVRDMDLLVNSKSVVIYPKVLDYSSVYTLEINNNLEGHNGENFDQVEVSFKTTAGKIEVISMTMDGKDMSTESRITNIPVDFEMTINFSFPVEPEAFEDAINISGTGVSRLNVSYTNGQKTAALKTSVPLQYLRKYEFTIANTLEGVGGESFDGFAKTLYTQVDSTHKFAAVTDEELLTKVQEHTFKYFWDFAHPNSGLARERNTSGDLVTIGGSGFGVMALIVGIERGFITRQEGVDRFEKIVNFLAGADTFHGVWPHWMNGNSGAVIPFSANDNGGDLVETAFMIQGLLTVREYLNATIPQEAEVIEAITQLWESVEWDWYTRGGENVLYWHWSPDYAWTKNHQVRGWNECLIVYVLAASSPTHAIDPEVYYQGWANNGNMRNGNSYYGVNLPLGHAFGGPLFFSHYSFLGLDPRNLEDRYADYWEQNVTHTLINRKHAIYNPQNYVGYGENAWGFTASDNHEGYAAHSPTNDKGVITPTAALSSMPYTPEASLGALKHFYYLMGDKLWGEYGFKDAYNPTAQWYANSYLAIDQGPIIVMIENHRSGLLWDHFMAAPEVRAGLKKLEFTYE